MLHFCSGMSSITDLHAALAEGVPVGVEAGRLDGPAERLLAFYLAVRGARALVDSGAFGGGADFARAIACYLRLARRLAPPGRLLVVAPDALLDMEATAGLQRLHAGALAEAARCGAEVLVPLQRGWEPGRYREHLSLMERSVPGAVPAFPCLPPFRWRFRDLLGLVEAARPRRVHLLGAGGALALSYAKAIAGVSRGTGVSADANRARAMIGRGRRITEQARRFSEQRRVESAGYLDRYYPGTEILDLFSDTFSFFPGEVRALALSFGVRRERELSDWEAAAGEECSGELWGESCRCRLAWLVAEREPDREGAARRVREALLRHARRESGAVGRYRAVRCALAEDARLRARKPWARQGELFS